MSKTLFQKVSSSAILFFVVMISSSVFAASFESSMNRKVNNGRKVSVGNYTGSPTWFELPYITWGGEGATFYANGGLKTKPGTIFAKQGLNVTLTKGDNFYLQVKNYMSGKTPFLRGTMSMIGQAAELLCRDARTCPQVFVQISFSRGDHCVATQNIRTISDLKGKRIAIQDGGPHPAFLHSILNDAGLTWNDVKVIWTKGLSDPAKLMKKGKADVAFAITPDMLSLIGGADKTGTGSEGTVKGAHMLVSTAERNKSIADVYAVRSDFYKAHPNVVTKLAAGHLKGAEQLVEWRKKWEKKNRTSGYKKLLKMTQRIYGTSVIPVLDEAHGLFMDAKFTHHHDNVDFFTRQNNFHGFAMFNKQVTQIAVDLGLASKRVDLKGSPLKWNSSDFIGYLSETKVHQAPRFNAVAAQKELEKMSESGKLKKKTVHKFYFLFSPNQDEFSIVEYAETLKKIVELSSSYGGAMMAIIGHADPSMTLINLVKAGMSKGTITRNCVGGKFKAHKVRIKSKCVGGTFHYKFNNRPFDLKATKSVVRAIKAGAFDGVASSNPRHSMQSAKNLSHKRAMAFVRAIMAYAKIHNYKLDASQFIAQGMGIREPVIPKPRNTKEAKKNMRVEVRIIIVPSEIQNDADFNL